MIYIDEEIIQFIHKIIRTKRHHINQMKEFVTKDATVIILEIILTKALTLSNRLRREKTYDTLHQRDGQVGYIVGKVSCCPGRRKLVFPSSEKYPECEEKKIYCYNMYICMYICRGLSNILP